MPGPGQLLTVPWAIRPGRIGGPVLFPGTPPGRPFVAAPGPAVASPVMLPGNLLSPADSDFELAWTGDWTGAVNCTVGQSQVRAFSGSQSMVVTAATTATVQVLGPSLLVPLNTGVVFSFYAYTTGTGRVATGALVSNGGLQTASGAGVTLGMGGWTPYEMASALTAGGVTSFSPQIQVTGMSAGETLWIDLVYTALSTVEVLVAWPTEPANTSPLFADMTPFTRADQPLTMFHGRQDNISEVAAGALSLTLSNDLGWFTEQNTASPFYPNIKLGRRIQVNEADEAGTWHTRFDGQVNDIELMPAPTGLQADATVQAGDVIALMNRQTGLASWTKEEILADSPVLHWTLDDPAGSSVAVESSGNQGPPLQLHNYGTTSPPVAYAFAGGTASTNGQQNGMESQTWAGIGTPAAFPAVYFQQQHGGGARTSQGNWQLQAPLPVTLTPGSTAFTIEAFAIPDVPNAAIYNNVNAYQFYLFTLADPRTGSYIGVYVLGGGANPVWNFVISQAGQVPSFGGAAWTFPATAGPQSIALECVPGGGGSITVSAYFNGVLQNTISSYGVSGLAFSYLTVGGPWTGYQGWMGQVSCVSIYNGALSAARLLAHYNKAQSGNYALRAGTVITQIAGYAGIPAFWNNVAGSAGLSFMEYFNLAGQNGLAAMQQAEAADGGVLYADALGRLNYAGRETRMGAGGPVLTLQAGQYEPDLGYKMTDQLLANEAAYSSAGISTGTAAINAASQADYGPYSPQGTAQSPTSAPLLTFNGWYQSYLNGTGGIVNAFSPDNLLWAAQWAANSHAQPSPKGASVRLDMRTLPATGPDGIAPSALYALDINSVIALAGLPSQFPNTAHANEYFVEGITETIQGGDTPVHSLVLYTSPASQGRAWDAGDPVYGRLDSTAVIGRSAAAAPASVPAFEFGGSVYPGPPYYPPSYGTAMNRTGFVGDLDQAGIWANLQQQVRPPMGIAAVVAAAQSIPNSASGPPAASTRLTWDTVYADTLGGFGWLAGFPNWFFTLVPGWWQLHAVVNFAVNATGRRAAWFLVGQRAARNGTGPVSGLNNIAPADVKANGNFPDAVAISTKIYCTLGTAIAVQAWQNSGGALNTATTRGGCLFAARFLGDSATED